MSFVPSVSQFGPVTMYAGQKAGKYPDGNQLIVRGADTVMAFDTPQVANHIGAAFDEQVDLVVLGHVHEDHMAGLHRLPQVPVHVHEHDVEAARSWDGLLRHFGYPPSGGVGLRAKLDAEFHYAPRPDAIAYRDGAQWDLGGGVRVHALHYPGHTAGHCVLLVEPAGIAFIGDIELSRFGPYYGDATSNLQDFRQSLARLAELPASVWITSHHKGAFTDRAAFQKALAAYAACIDVRETTLINRLRAAPSTVAELAESGLLYPAGWPSPSAPAIERRSIVQHLSELEAQGRVERLDDEVPTRSRYRLRH